MLYFTVWSRLSSSKCDWAVISCFQFGKKKLIFVCFIDFLRFSGHSWSTQGSEGSYQLWWRQHPWVRRRLIITVFSFCLELSGISPFPAHPRVFRLTKTPDCRHPWLSRIIGCQAGNPQAFHFSNLSHISAVITIIGEIANHLAFSQHMKPAFSCFKFGLKQRCSRH